MRYRNNTILHTPTNRPYFKSKSYPNIPLSETDVYVITTVGDRLDSLAFSYYKDSSLWWVIAMANNNITSGLLYPIPGTQLRIPTNISQVLRLFDQYNKAK